MATKLSRRDFLRTSGIGAAALVLGALRLPSEAAEPVTPSMQPLEGYGDWRDVYRDKWTWDRVVKCTHTRVNCISGCSWNVYVKDNTVWREEQAQVYEGPRGGAPDFFPRGCQKGACYSDLMVSPSRLRYPLARVGERGAGKWKRITWEEALDRVADGIIDAAIGHGADTVVYDQGTTNIDFGPGTAGELRLMGLLRAANVDGWAGVGDMPMGCVQTWGMFNCEGTADDWFLSDYIIVWSGNPVYTRIPEMHFITEARYRGARLVVIAPDYNATSVHADLWLNPRVQTDPALALSIAQVLISERRYIADYVREQTDLPLLLRKDNGRFLRQSDIEKGGADDVFLVWDDHGEKMAPAPGSQGLGRGSLALGGMRPALDGSHRVRLKDGTEVEVEPVLESMRRYLDAEYTPEKAQSTTGVHPDVVRRVAHDMSMARSAMIIASWGACKHHHSDLMHRSFALLMALTGNQGRPGGGLRIASWWTLSGFEQMSARYEIAWWQNLMLKMAGRLPVREMERLMTERTREEPFTPLMPWLYVHAGYAETAGRDEYNDPKAGVTIDEALKEAIDKGWIPVYPPPGKDPKVLIFSAPNPLRRWPTPQIARKHLWPKLDLIVNVNFRLSTTGLHCDLLLPAAGYYEKEGIKYTQAYLPYVIMGDKAVEPLGEARSEWSIFGTLARRIQERAIERGIGPAKDSFGKDVDLRTIFDQWSDDGRFDPDDFRTGMKYIFENSEMLRDTTWDEAAKLGVIPVKVNGHYSTVSAICTDQDMSKPLYPHAWQVEQKEPWPTLTGRQQFYIDHDWYLRAGEAFPVHKNPPAAGGNYPLRLTGGHTRWSIHAIWRDSELMLRLQRGEPVLYLNSLDARERSIADNDRVRVYNDVGAFQALAKPSGSVQRGQAIIYHAWEPYQHPDQRGQQEPVVAPWKALHLAGGYGQLHYRVNYGAPGHSPRGSTVEVERA